MPLIFQLFLLFELTPVLSSSHPMLNLEHLNSRTPFGCLFLGDFKKGEICQYSPFFAGYFLSSYTFHFDDYLDNYQYYMITDHVYSNF